MDDALTINLRNYLSNPFCEKNKFTKDEVLSAILSSPNWTYDTLNDKIKPNYKAKRRIIVFRDIPKDKQNEDEMKKLFKIKESEENKNLQSKISKINKINEIFYFYFNSEEDALQAFKYLEELRERPDKVNYFLIPSHLNLVHS